MDRVIESYTSFFESGSFVSLTLFAITGLYLTIELMPLFEGVFVRKVNN